MIDLQEELRSGLDYGRRLLSAEDLGFSRSRCIWVVARYTCLLYDVKRSSSQLLSKLYHINAHPPLGARGWIVGQALEVAPTANPTLVSVKLSQLSSQLAMSSFGRQQKTQTDLQRQSTHTRVHTVIRRRDKRTLTRCAVPAKAISTDNHSLSASDCANIRAYDEAPICELESPPLTIRCVAQSPGEEHAPPAWRRTYNRRNTPLQLGGVRIYTWTNNNAPPRPLQRSSHTHLR